MINEMSDNRVRVLVVDDHMLLAETVVLALTKTSEIDAEAVPGIDAALDRIAKSGPFDVILLTACAQTVPASLLEQLSYDGVLIAPLEDPDGSQWLTQVKRIGSAFEKRRLEPVRFVPLLQGVVD